MSPFYTNVNLSRGFGVPFFGAKPWTAEDAARRAAANGTKPTAPKPQASLAELEAKRAEAVAPKPKAPPVDPRIAELQAKRAEVTRLRAAVAKREREDAMAAELQAKRAEVERLRAEVDAKTQPGRGIRFASGEFRAFGHVHAQR